MTQALNFASGITALIAALLWLYSARVKVQYDPTPARDGMIPGAIVDDENNDVLASIQAGIRWSMWASIAAGIAALLQSIAVFVK